MEAADSQFWHSCFCKTRGRLGKRSHQCPCFSQLVAGHPPGGPRGVFAVPRGALPASVFPRRSCGVLVLLFLQGIEANSAPAPHIAVSPESQLWPYLETGFLQMELAKMKLYWVGGGLYVQRPVSSWSKREFQTQTHAPSSHVKMAQARLVTTVSWVLSCSSLSVPFTHTSHFAQTPSWVPSICYFSFSPRGSRRKKSADNAIFFLPLINHLSP